jgi:hypothetical protein
MSRTHDVTISAFDLDRLEAELTAAIEQRDMLLTEREQWRMSSVCRELSEQRDRLAEALRELCETLLNDKPRDITESLYKAGDALAAWKGGSDERPMGNIL